MKKLKKKAALADSDVASELATQVRDLLDTWKDVGDDNDETLIALEDAGRKAAKALDDMAELFHELGV